MKLCKIWLEGFQQFKLIEIDLTYPKGHEKEFKPLEKVCFIGRNGTGKSTLLTLIRDFLSHPTHLQNRGHLIHDDAQFGFEYEFNGHRIFIGKLIGEEESGVKHIYGSMCFPIEMIKENYGIIRNVFTNRDFKQAEYLKSVSDRANLDFNNIIHDGVLHFFDHPSKENFLIYAPNESATNQSMKIDLFSSTNLDKALGLFKTMPFYHEIAYENLHGFWSLVIYQVKKREKDKEAYILNNRKRVIQEVIDEFDANNPDFLKVLASRWNPILETSGIYFDYESASLPTQNDDKLVSHFRLVNKHQTRSDVLQYSAMSTGMRNVLFRLGYLSALFHNRNVKHSFALFDEPELGLYADLLYDIVDWYYTISPSTQFFFSTHSPIVAAQFDPFERVILEFDENKYVKYTKGRAPEGDHPNDLLEKDFDVRNLFGKVGVEKWERFLELNRLLKTDLKDKLRKEYAREFFEIGSNYDFLNYEENPEE